MKQNIIIGAIMVIVFICGWIRRRDADREAQLSNANGNAAENNIFFRVNGEEVKTSGWNINRFDMGTGVQINITSNMHQDKRTIAFNLNGQSTGVYKLRSDSREKGTANGSYMPNYSDLLSSYSFEDGKITITGIDTVTGVLNASFQGVAQKNGKIFTITDGKILNGKIGYGVKKY